MTSARTRLTRWGNAIGIWLYRRTDGRLVGPSRGTTIGLLTAIHDEVPRLRSFLFVDDVVEVTGLLDARTRPRRRFSASNSGRTWRYPFASSENWCRTCRRAHPAVHDRPHWRRPYARPRPAPRRRR